MPASTTIAVKHNIEVAHRLYELPGKCEQIHGHSMWVTMELTGVVNDKGILAGIEYGDLKKVFRSYLDSTYDHRLLLNAADPFAGPIFMAEKVDDDGKVLIVSHEQQFLPGLQAFDADPTTENIAKWINRDMQSELMEVAQHHDNLWAIDVTVWETSVNMARYKTERHPL